MILRLGLLFTVIPTLELALLIFIGTQIGVLWATAIVVATGFAGAWLAKREGVGMTRRLRRDLQRGLPPARRIAEGALVLAGALLLLTPGIMTDITGFLLIIPWSRRRLAPILVRLVVRWVTGSRELAAAMDLRFSDDDDEEDDEDDDHPSPRRRREPRSERPPSPFDHPVA